jgi:hypothetical protein
MMRARTTAVERLEARLVELKEQQAKLMERKKIIEATRGAEERRKTRKLENSRKFEFGGLVKIVGMFDWDKGQFTGALLSIKDAASDEAMLLKLKLRGDTFLAGRERSRKESDASPQVPKTFNYDYEALP